MTWDGKERRLRSEDDRRQMIDDRRKIEEAQRDIRAVHEVVIKVDLNFDNFLKRFSDHVASEERFHLDHAQQDQRHFDRIYPMMDSLKKFMYTSSGVAIGLGTITTVIAVIVFIRGH